MKKTFYSVAVMVVMFFSSLFLSACGDPAITGISVKSGTLGEYTIVDTDYSLEDLTLKVTYDNGDVKEVPYSKDITVTGLDTSELGEQVLTVKYLDYTTTFTVTVVELDEFYEYLGYQKPDAYTHFEQRRNAATSNPEVETNFSVGGETYKVGDDNPFKFLPKINAVTANGDSVDVNRYNSVVTVKHGGVVLEGLDLAFYVSVDTAQSTFDFTEKAVGEEFEITVKPTTYETGAPYSPITFTVEVVDGWNVDSVAELSRVEYNPTAKQYVSGLNGKDLWADKKAETGIVDVPINAVVIHCDLEIKRSDLPDGLFHPAGTVHDGKDLSGTLIDSMSFFTRDVNYDETFEIHGNYFSISTRNSGEDAIPRVRHYTHDEMLSHSAVFAFGGDNEHAPRRVFNGHVTEEAPQGEVTINNLSLKGNGSRESGDTAEDSIGGLLGILSTAHKLTINNSLIRAFTSHVVTAGDFDYNDIADDLIIDGAGPSEEMAVHINNTKMIDSFTTMMLAWGTRNTYINNSVMKAAGGPLIIATHPNDDDNHPNYTSNITAKDSVMENKVMGSEAWFNLTGAASVITGLKAVNGLFTGISSYWVGEGALQKVTSLTDSLEPNAGLINFLTCSMGDDTIAEDKAIASSTTITDENDEVITKLDMTNPFIGKILANGFFSGMMNFIFECNGVFAVFNGDMENPDLLLLVDKQTLIDAGIAETLLDERFPTMFSKEEGAPDKVVGISMMTLQHALCAEAQIQGAVAGMVLRFLQADYYNMYIANVLGCTYEMFHLDPPAQA